MTGRSMRAARHRSLTPPSYRLPSNDIVTTREPDRSWTVAPTLLWFAAALALGLAVLDGDERALADRLTAKRDDAAAGGPAIAARPPIVADRDDADDVAPVIAPPGPKPAGRGSGGGTTSAPHAFGALADTCVDGDDEHCKRWAMDAFFQAVADERAGKHGRPVRVSWYGDSVIATDAIPGRLRARLQAELGDGGPGFVYVVAPHRFCGHEAIARSSGGGWLTYAISTQQIADGLYGPGGSTALADDGRATIKLVRGKVTSVELYYLAQPNGGTVALTADGSELASVDTRADAKRAAWTSAVAKDGLARLELQTRGRARLFGVDLENARGAVVDNLGIVSVNVKSFTNNDRDHWASELAHRGADLVMIMIGANEAEWLAPGDRDTRAYQQHYEAVLAPIRKGVPGASCLVVSPTDQAEAKDGGYPSRPVMPVLIDAQRKAARAQGCAFYSTYDWMGGKGSAAKWFRKGLVGSDFQHLSKRGADRLADAVYEALVAGAKSHAGR